MQPEELEQAIRNYHSMLYRLAYSYVSNAADAEDLCQEAFLRLYRADEVFAGDENCKAWLIRVTINLSKNLLRSSWRTRHIALEDCTNVPAAQLPDDSLLTALSTLPPKYRSVLYLHYYEGYSAKEIAQMLQKSTSAVTTQLARGRAKLKAILEQEEAI